MSTVIVFELRKVAWSYNCLLKIIYLKQSLAKILINQSIVLRHKITKQVLTGQKTKRQQQRLVMFMYVCECSRVYVCVIKRERKTEETKKNKLKLKNLF